MKASNTIMKKFHILLAALALLIGFSSCDSFLDAPKPTDSLTEEDVFSSTEGVEAFISGIHRRFRGQYASTTDVGGVYSMYFARTVKGNDFVVGSSWYQFDYANDNREPAYRRTRVTWEYLYYMINQSNLLIQGVQKSTLADSDKAAYTAQGKALRAFFYFQLALEFQQTYALDPQAAAPPLYLEPTTEAKGMSTMQEMYTQILKDLNEADADIPTTRSAKSYINKAVVNGIKARVLMAMNQDWDQVEAAAKIAYGGSIASALNADEYADGFDDIRAKEWIWGMDQQSDQSNYYYAAPHAFTDHDAAGYLNTYVIADLVKSFSATDVRNLFRLKAASNVGKWSEFVTSKFKFTFESDLPLMRTAEMVLAQAEALYHQGKEAEAHDVLFQLQVNRDPQAVKSAATGSALLGEILLERRKELYGELGVEWFDAKRLQRAIVRNPLHRVKADLAVNDKHFFLKIPQTEIDANPNIDASVNDNR